MSELFNCLEATRLISKGQHVQLSLSETTLLNNHIVLCGCCQGFKKDLEFIKDKLFHTNQNYTLDPLVKENISRKILSELEK